MLVVGWSFLVHMATHIGVFPRCTYSSGIDDDAWLIHGDGEGI